jgi:hypothetical protein
VFRLALSLPQFNRAQKRLHPREILSRFPHFLQPFGLTGRNLKAQAKNQFSQLALLQFEFACVHLPKLLHSAGH